MDVCECTAVLALVLCMAFFTENLRKCCRATLPLAKFCCETIISVTVGRAVAACAATARGDGELAFPVTLMLGSTSLWGHTRGGAHSRYQCHVVRHTYICMGYTCRGYGGDPDAIWQGYEGDMGATCGGY